MSEHFHQTKLLKKSFKVLKDCKTNTPIFKLGWTLTFLLKNTLSTAFKSLTSLAAIPTSMRGIISYTRHIKSFGQIIQKSENLCREADSLLTKVHKKQPIPNIRIPYRELVQVNTNKTNQRFQVQSALIKDEISEINYSETLWLVWVAWKYFHAKKNTTSFKKHLASHYYNQALTAKGMSGLKLVEIKNRIRTKGLALLVQGLLEKGFKGFKSIIVKNKYLRMKLDDLY